MSLPEICPGCSTPTGEGENWNRSFVPYEAAPNGGQTETDWVDDIPPKLYAFICTGCGRVLGVFDKHSLDEEELPDPPSAGDDFRVDHELQ